MPELPEVETTIKGLQKKVLNRAFVDVWTDWKKTIKKPKSFEEFRKEIKNKKIKRIWRRAKNVIFDLSGGPALNRTEGYSLLVHQKMTGHLLVGKWELKNDKWKPVEKGPLEEKINLYIHLMFYLSGGLMMALSDMRIFAKVELWKTDELKKELEKLGPEPLEKNFTFGKFRKVLRGKKGKVKQVLMDQNVIAGIGNIYSSEALWHAKTHPEKNVADLNDKELKSLYNAIKKVLELGAESGGESFSDYRKPDGTKGDFDKERKVYRREGQKCSRCGGKIKRLKVGQRSAFYCPACQKL